MMGLLDELAGAISDKITGKIDAQKQDPVPQHALLNGAIGLINEAGGLSGLLQKFHDGGLGEQVASWVSTGENQAVSGDQIKDALGEETVQKIAQESGVSPEHASAGLAQLLPQIINKLTPDGEVPHGDFLQQGLSLLKGKLFG